MTRRRGHRGEPGQASLLIVGLAFVLVLMTAVVVDASAAFLQRQGLDTVADGAALAGADAGARGEEAYTEGVDEERLRLWADSARTGVADYLARSGAHERYPGLTVEVAVDPTGRRVVVRVRAPLDLPFTVPGSPNRPVIGAEGAAVVAPRR
ncbi:MAG: pilus assembly protein TadG-related protein [Nocardioides sp.]